MTITELEQAKKGIGTRLRDTRISKGFTQKKLGVLAGTNRAVIQKIENGKVWQPRIVAELASALGVNPAWLQWGEPFAPMRVDYCQIAESAE